MVVQNKIKHALSLQSNDSVRINFRRTESLLDTTVYDARFFDDLQHNIVINTYNNVGNVSNTVYTIWYELILTNLISIIMINQDI